MDGDRNSQRESAPDRRGSLNNEAWRRTALGLRLSRERIEVLRHQPHPTPEPANPGEVLEALKQFDATFPARGARAVALEHSAGAPIQAALDQLRALRASEDILVLADGTGTTQEHRGRERTVVAITERLTATRIEPLPFAPAAREAIGSTGSSPRRAGGCLRSSARRSTWRAVRTGWW